MKSTPRGVPELDDLIDKAELERLLGEQFLVVAHDRSDTLPRDLRAEHICIEDAVG